MIQHDMKSEYQVTFIQGAPGHLVYVGPMQGQNKDGGLRPEIRLAENFVMVQNIWYLWTETEFQPPIQLLGYHFNNQHVRYIIYISNHCKLLAWVVVLVDF